MMHSNGKIACITGVDKKPILLLSTHAKPLYDDPTNPGTIPRMVEVQKINFPTFPVHVAYTKWMQGVDVFNQFQVKYSSKIQSYK